MPSGTPEALQLSSGVALHSQRWIEQQEDASLGRQGVQGDPVCRSSKLVGVTLCKKALFPEDGQPMVRYYFRWF